MKIKYIYMCALLLVIVSCSSKKEVNEFISPVFYEKVGLTSDSKTFSFPGVIQSSQEPRLSFRVAGTIESIKVELGDTLKKGAVIATLDRSDYAVNYNKSVSALKGAEASFIAAKAAFARAEKLYVNGNLSLSDYEKAKLQFESAQSMKTSTLFMVEAAKNQLDYTFLRAPFSGVVTSLFIKEREIAAPGVPIIVLSGLEAVEVKSFVPVNLIGKLKRGDSVSVYLNSAPDKKYLGAIKELSLGTVNTSAYPIIIKMDKIKGELFSGMSVTVEVVVSDNDAAAKGFIITSNAVAHDYSGDHVYVAVMDSLENVYYVSKRSVVLGQLKQDGYLVLEGLEKGEIVITAGLSYLYEGKKVRLIL